MHDGVVDHDGLRCSVGATQSRSAPSGATIKVGPLQAGRSDGQDLWLLWRIRFAVIGRLSVLIGVKGQSGLLALASRHLIRSAWSQESEVASAADRVTSAAGAKLTINTT